MSTLNGDFEVWDNGTSFLAGVNLPNNQQLANDWYYSQGSAGTGVGSTVIARTTTHNTGAFALGFKLDSGQSGANTTTFVYQEVSNYTDFLDQDVTFICALKSAGAGSTGKIFIDDGVTTTFSSSSTLSGNWEMVRVDKHIDASGTVIRLGIIPDLYNTNQLLIDTAGFGLTLELSLSQTITPSNTFATNAARENFESILVEDDLDTDLIVPGELDLSELMFVDDTFNTDHILLNLVDNISSTDVFGADGYLSISSVILLEDECNTGNAEELNCSDSVTFAMSRELALADSLVMSDTLTKTLPEVEKTDALHTQDWVGLKLISNNWTN